MSERRYILQRHRLTNLLVSKTSLAGRINTTRAGCDVQERAYATRM
jgi:hypothetical protein